MYARPAAAARGGHACHLLGPEGGQQILQVERQLVFCGSAKIPCVSGAVCKFVTRARQYGDQHHGSDEDQQAQNGVGRLGQRRHPPQIDDRQYTEQADRCQRDRTGAAAPPAATGAEALVPRYRRAAPRTANLYTGRRPARQHRANSQPAAAVLARRPVPPPARPGASRLSGCAAAR